MIHIIFRIYYYVLGLNFAHQPIEMDPYDGTSAGTNITTDDVC